MKSTPMDHSTAVMSPHEAFALLLSSTYPTKPNLAESINSATWFHYPEMHKSEGNAEDFVAAQDAFKRLTDSVKSGAIRLVGTLEAQSPPTHIPRADAREGELRIWDRELVIRVNGKLVRKYLRVSCVEGDAIEALRPPALTQERKPFNQKTALAFVTEYFKSEREAKRVPTLTGLRAAALNAGHAGARSLIDAIYKNLMANAGHPVRRGRRSGKSAK